MFYAKADKLYVLKDEKTLVGVDVAPQVLPIKGTELTVDDFGEYEVYTPSEVNARFIGYKFPVEEKEVKKPKTTK